MMFAKIPGKQAIITSLEKAVAALKGETGTTISGGQLTP
jgi:carbamate kinase